MCHHQISIKRKDCTGSGLAVYSVCQGEVSSIAFALDITTTSNVLHSQSCDTTSWDGQKPDRVFCQGTVTQVILLMQEIPRTSWDGQYSPEHMLFHRFTGAGLFFINSIVTVRWKAPGNHFMHDAHFEAMFLTGWQISCQVETLQVQRQTLCHAPRVAGKI